VLVEYGTVVPEGSLPVFSVGSEAEARWLLVLACSTNRRGRFVAEELVHEQTVENLVKFSDRLAQLHDQHIAGTERCDCDPARERA
jgi:hypothetical protein